MNSESTRRVFLARTAGLTLTLGSHVWNPALARGLRNPYSQGQWLAGDHHIHTKYSYDGQYEIQQQVANAVKYGLGWCVITDHGGPHHDKVAIAQAYPELQRARRLHPEILVFQGMEWNIPAAEHGSIILPPTRDEAERIANFEAIYDEKNISRDHKPANTETDAVNAFKYLQNLSPKPLFMANHPARRGLDSPHEFRNWSDAGTDVARGFEGAPGHAACTLAGKLRGEYDNSPGKNSFPGYPQESYRTYGGYDWYTAKVGGLWDSLLGEGRNWYITADSDSHRHWDDRDELDTSTYLTNGYVTNTGRRAEKGTDFDFYPGEYSKTWVFAPHRHPLAILDSIRSGSMFTVLGGLIDRLELWAHTKEKTARMGSTLTLEKAGEDVTIIIRIRVPASPNSGGTSLKMHHIDLIAGDIVGRSSDRDSMINPTTKIVAQITPAEAKIDGQYLSFTHTFRNVRKSFYVRIRGTNTDVELPKQDAPGVNPWEDMWFYSNPIMIQLPAN